MALMQMDIFGSDTPVKSETPAVKKIIPKESDEYLDFLKKFETKKTTDDCYTPVAVYDVVADYVSKRWGICKRSFVRPFFPGGDFENFDYKDGCVVVDNPPFSIFTKIIKFYTARKIPFFLFGPNLTLFSSLNNETTAIVCCAQVIYENGANVSTSFITNLPSDNAVEVLPELRERINYAQKSTMIKKNQRKLSYPSCVVNSARIGRYAVHGIKVELKRNGCRRIPSFGNTSIFGGGLLLDRANASAIERANASAIERANAILPTAQDEAMMKEMGW